MKWEENYLDLVEYIGSQGNHRETRNGFTRSIFGITLSIDTNEGFPLLQSRKMNIKGIVGEMNAFLNQPKTLKDFEAKGCNFWKLWAKPDGTIDVDYGNKWMNWNGINQLQNVIDKIKTDPTDRRLLVTGWDPESTPDLPCCHLLYQWYVRDGYLDMNWYQRSVDLMIGLPSDIASATCLNMLMAHLTGLKSGRINFMMGDVHIYEEHLENARELALRAPMIGKWCNMPKPKAFIHLEATTLANGLDHFELTGYESLEPLKFKLKE